MSTPKSQSHRWTWTPARYRAAQELADDRLSDEQIAARAGVHRATLHRWKQHPEFAARVHELQEQYLKFLTDAVAAEMAARWQDSFSRSRARQRR